MNGDVRMEHDLEAVEKYVGAKYMSAPSARRRRHGPVHSVLREDGARVSGEGRSSRCAPSRKVISSPSLTPAMQTMLESSPFPFVSNRVRIKSRQRVVLQKSRRAEGFPAAEPDPRPCGVARGRSPLVGPASLTRFS